MICEKCFCTASLIYVSLKFVSYVSYLIMYIGTSPRYFKNMLMITIILEVCRSVFIFANIFTLWNVNIPIVFVYAKSHRLTNFIYLFIILQSTIYEIIYSCHKSLLTFQKAIYQLYTAVRLNTYEYIIPGSCRSHQIVYTQVMKILVILLYTAKKHNCDTMFCVV